MHREAARCYLQRSNSDDHCSVHLCRRSVSPPTNHLTGDYPPKQWTVHPTPGWHFGHSETGYTNSAMSLYWIQHVFDAQTKDRAKDRPRMLINGFGTHKSLEIMQYCYENNIILCRLPSHTSYKLQPCDVGVFGPMRRLILPA